MSLQAKHDPFYQTTIIGLFISPKVERDEVLIYNSSCSVTMATEAEMECQGPNQPITAKITEIRKNWGQSTQDALPKFCSLWSKNSSWLSGHPPVDGDNVTVERRQTLVLDTNTSVLNLLHVKGGKLLFLSPGPVQLHAHYILVSEGGELQVGTLAQPFTGKAQIFLYGSPFSSPFYPYGVKFLAVRNATISMHGWVPQVTSTHLALNAHAHDTILAVMEPVDWRTGYNIVICGVDFRGYKMHEEILTIENVNNAYISVQSPLRYSYEILEQFVDEQPITLRPIITLLSRNIVVQGNITKENVNNQLEYNHLDMSDIPNCFYDANEESLGSRNLGSVLIIQSLYNEPSQVFISGVQFQHIGQTFRKQLSGLNIVGNIFMTGSYIQGCVVLNSFARGLSISGVSGFKVENNIFYNIKGHGILVGEYLEEDIEIKTNLLIKISGSKVLSNTEMLAPAAIYLRAPSNIIEVNTVWSAGYGYLYHLSPDGPSQTPLKSFKKNKAIACLRSGLWLHPEHQPSDFDAVAVIQGFTAWRSRGGIQISRCRNIDFRDFNIYDCKDFGINIIVSNGRITISDSLLLGHIHGKNDGCMKNGIQTPKNFQSVFLYNTTFVNFNMTTCIAISTCTECSKGQGGFTVQIQQLRFLNSPRQVMFPFPHSSLIEDRDGSISGLEGSHLLASVDLLPDSCKENSNITATIPGSVCGSNVVFHRVSIGLRKAPDFNYNLTVINSMNKSIDVNYAKDTLSNLYGWLVLLVDKEKYTIIFDTANMSKELQYSATFDNFGTGNFMLIEHTNLSSLFEIHISCGSKSGQHLQSLPEPLKNSACDWYFDNRQGTVTYLVAGEGRVSLNFSAEQKMAVPTIVPSSQPQSVFKWSSPESWKGVETHWGGYSSSIPLPGDDVIILPNRTIIVDIVLPPLRGLYVLGTLEFPTDASNVLNVTCIIIAGGELRVGTEQKLFEREQSLQIFLRSSEGIHCDRLDSLNVSSGEIGVYGKLQMHSAYASKSWTRLGADIAPGNEMIVLKDTVDWKQGDNIVISSSSYEAHQAEMVQLRESHGHVIRIWEKLIYRHTGDIYNIEDTWELPLSAEVGLLSRNIQIKSDIACSSRIVVGQYKQHNGVEYSDVTFSGFTTTCYSNDGDICIMSNPHNIGIMSPITAERTKMTHIKHQNLLYFHSALSSPDCPSSKECYGTQKVLFKDLDGRSLGLTPPVTVFPKSEMESWNSCFNTGIYRKDSKCTYNSDLQGHICQQIDHAVVVLENIGHTTQPISPVLSITSNFIDVFINGNISRDQCCYSTDHPKFYSILPASKITKVCFNGPTPKAMRLKLNGNQNTTKIVLALFYDTPQSCYISTRGKKIISNLSVTEPTFEKEEHGSSFFSFSKNLLYVVLQGDEPVEIWTNLSIYLAFYVVKGTAMNIHGQLLIELANYFGIDQSQITGLQILQGNVKALRTMTDNHAKKSLHCSTVLSVADEKTHFKYKREMKKNVEYSRHLRGIDVSFLELLIVEIGNPVAPVYHTTGFKLVPLLTYEKLQLIASTVIDDLQTGVLEKLIPMNVDSLMVIETDDSSFGSKIRNISEPGSEARAFVRPHKIHLQQQPSDGILGLPLAVQPQVIFLDVKGNRVENLGHPLNPWSLAVYLKGYSSKDLKGKSVIPVQDGWGNFSDLAVSSSGSNFYLIINVTSPQGVAFTVQSKEFNIFPVTTGDKENVFMLVVLTSAASAIALFLFLCCFFKKNKIKIKKQIGKRK